MPGLQIQLAEWQRATPQDMPALAGATLSEERSVRATVEQLAQSGMLELLELRSGLEIRTTSFIGRVRLGDLQITVHPKLPIDVLFGLFRYAYDLRDLKLFETAEHSALPEAFQDLLISQLAAEVSELIGRGLYRRYEPIREPLAAPRGRIDLQRIAREGGIHEASLPCAYYPRLDDTLLNQVILSGLMLAAHLTDDLILRARTRRLAAILETTVSHCSLNRDVLRRANRQMSRLTAAYAPTLMLVRLLAESMGVSLESDSQLPPLPGFLFDMNRFFEALIGRFLRENLPGYQVQEQHQLRGMMSYAPGYNPRHRQSPTPRPDFVISRNGTRVAMLDTKYRDIWEKGLPRDMLYQLAIYALSQGAGGHSAILYPTLEPSSKIEIIDIRDAAFGDKRAQVEIRPVNLSFLASLIRIQGIRGQRERAEYAQWLALNHHVSAVAHKHD